MNRSHHFPTSQKISLSISLLNLQLFKAMGSQYNFSTRFLKKKFFFFFLFFLKNKTRPNPYISLEILQLQKSIKSLKSDRHEAVLAKIHPWLLEQESRKASMEEEAREPHAPPISHHKQFVWDFSHIGFLYDDDDKDEEEEKEENIVIIIIAEKQSG